MHVHACPQASAAIGSDIKGVQKMRQLILNLLVMHHQASDACTARHNKMETSSMQRLANAFHVEFSIRLHCGCLLAMKFADRFCSLAPASCRVNISKGLVIKLPHAAPMRQAKLVCHFTYRSAAKLIKKPSPGRRCCGTTQPKQRCAWQPSWAAAITLPNHLLGIILGHSRGRIALCMVSVQPETMVCIC